MKAVLIDPFVQVCTDIELPQSGYYETRSVIECRTAGSFYPNIIDVPGYDGRFICWIDDDGLLADEVAPLWTIEGYGQPIAGRGILRGLDNDEGDHLDCPLPARVVQELLITWRTDLKFVGMITHTEENAEHPILGKMTKISSVATFEKVNSDGE